MKKKLKKLVPSFVKRIIINIKFRFELSKFIKDDEKRFYKYSAHQEFISDEGNLNSKLVYFSHQIEKGISRKNFRFGFGRQAINNLVITLNTAKAYPNIKNNIFYLNALSSLKSYKEKHYSINQNLKTPNFDLISKDFYKEIENSPDLAGVNSISVNDKSKNNTLNFKNLALNRYSIRDYKVDEDVDILDIKEAIEISMKTPSVCNRQPSRVKIISDKDLISSVIKLQGGFNGYELPNKLLLVTSDTSVFLRPSERNQPFIDGGAFSMSLLYGLEYKKIACCPLSTNISMDNTKRVRNLLDIPEKEVLIMFIACGVMEDTVLSPKSHRLLGENIITIL